MMTQIFSLLAGVIFAIGLSVSGMINPDKVQGFLDIFGNWDYSLAFVMGGAVGFNFFAFKFLQSRKPVCANEHFLPSKKDVDKKIVFGSALFGIGWGLVGICPGPAIVNAITLDPQVILFILAMIVGMLVYKPFEK